MSRQPGYETTSYTGHGYEDRRETTAGRQAVDIGRPRGAGYSATARHAQAEASDVELMKMRLRMLELERIR